MVAISATRHHKTRSSAGDGMGNLFPLREKVVGRNRTVSRGCDGVDRFPVRTRCAVSPPRHGGAVTVDERRELRIGHVLAGEEL
jgi:hypothetical protein